MTFPRTLISTVVYVNVLKEMNINQEQISDSYREKSKHTKIEDNYHHCYPEEKTNTEKEKAQ